jgi:hypothetical protein
LPHLVSRWGDSRRGRIEEGAFFIFSDACVPSPRKIGDGKIFVTNVKFMANVYKGTQACVRSHVSWLLLRVSKRGFRCGFWDGAALFAAFGRAPAGAWFGAARGALERGT